MERLGKDFWGLHGHVHSNAHKNALTNLGQTIPATLEAACHQSSTDPTFKKWLERTDFHHFYVWEAPQLQPMQAPQQPQQARVDETIVDESPPQLDDLRQSNSDERDDGVLKQAVARHNDLLQELHRTQERNTALVARLVVILNEMAATSGVIQWINYSKNLTQFLTDAPEMVRAFGDDDDEISLIDTSYHLKCLPGEVERACARVKLVCSHSKREAPGTMRPLVCFVGFLSFCWLHNYFKTKKGIQW